MHRHDNPANIPSPRPASALVAVLALLAAVGATAPEARADHGLCGQPVSSGVEPVAGDALRTLRTAVNVDECMPGGDICACDVDGSGAVRSTDALMVLSRAVDPAVPLACASSCARAVSPADGGPGAGRDLYDAACSSCHSARPYDTTGFAGDIAGRFGLPNNLGTISGAMNGIVLDDMQLAELEAFLMDVTWSPTPTSTTTTTLPGSSTSTSTTTSTSTSLPSSPTTTLGDLEADGRFLYDVVCASCHRAGSHDTQGYAGDIAGDGDELTNDLGRLSSQMRGIILDDGQIDSLAAFLDSVGGGSGGGGEDDDEGFEGDDDGDDDHGGIDDDGDDDGDDDSDDDHDDDHDDDGFESDDDHGADYGTDRDHDRDDDDEGDDD